MCCCPKQIQGGRREPALGGVSSSSSKRDLWESEVPPQGVGKTREMDIRAQIVCKSPGLERNPDNGGAGAQTSPRRRLRR